MAKARNGKQLHIITENKLGMLTDITTWLADKGINIKTMFAYVADNKAHFKTITADNKKAIEILKTKKLEASEEEVVTVEIMDKLGTLKDMTKKLKTAEIDIKYLYGTTTNAPNVSCTIVFDSSDNQRAINTING